MNIVQEAHHVGAVTDGIWQSRFRALGILHRRLQIVALQDNALPIIRIIVAFDPVQFLVEIKQTEFVALERLLDAAFGEHDFVRGIDCR